VIVINDGSTDNTSSIVKNFISSNKGMRISFIDNKKNEGKGQALQTAFNLSKTDYFACMDCDSTVEPNALNKIINTFTEKNIGAVIPTVKVDNPKNIYESIQRVEYLLSNLVRHLLSKMGTLFLTHGVLSVFRSDYLKKVGGFDTDRKKYNRRS